MTGFLIILLVVNLCSVLHADTITLKGQKELSYRTYIEKCNLYFQYKAGSRWSEPMILDEGCISEHSSAIILGDYLHITWCKNGRVCYQTNYKPITPNSIKRKDKLAWSEKVFISPYFTEPATKISLTILGEYVKVTWQAPAEYDSTIDEKWQRRRWLQDVPNAWEPPECLSKLSTKNQKN